MELSAEANDGSIVHDQGSQLKPIDDEPARVWDLTAQSYMTRGLN